MTNHFTEAKYVANYFLSKEGMTNKKLQKIVYYAYCWSLTILNNPEEIEMMESENNFSNKLFPEKIEAWVHGPVIPELYHQYKEYGWETIPKETLMNTFPEEIENVFEMVWDIYGKYDGDQLENITHQEAPWQESRQGLETFEPSNNEIEDEDIYNYYRQYIVES